MISESNQRAALQMARDVTEPSDLLGQISTEEIGPGHRRFVNAGSGNEPIREARINSSVSSSCDPDERIGGAHSRRQRFALQVGLEAFAQKGGVAFVDFLESSDRGDWIRKGLGRDLIWR